MVIYSNNSTHLTVYYLYVKTHLVTGLKYLGYTKAQDPHKYQGSGKYWLLHLAKHGVNYDTEILLTTSDINEIKTYGQHYSFLWNVVESDNWANLKPETGNGGFAKTRKGFKLSPDEINRRTATRRANNSYKQTPKSIAKMIETKNKNGTGIRTASTVEKIINKRRLNGTYKQTSDSIAKGLETKRRNGTTGKGQKKLPSSVAKQLETKRRNGTLNSTTQESVAKGLETKRRNGTLNSTTQESVAKGLETKRRNGTLNSTTQESREKWKETMLERYGSLNTHTLESKAAISAALTGKKLSAETIAKRTASRKANKMKKLDDV